MFTVAVSALQEALTGLAKVVPNKTRLPVLGMVRIRSAGNGSMTLTVTDLEQHLTYTADCAMADAAPVDVLVPLKDLRDLVRKAGKGGQVGIAAAGKDSAKVEYEAGQQRMSRTLPTMPVEEYPVGPEAMINAKEPVAVGADAFARIRDAFPSASKDQTRRMITGVLVEPGLVVATDGKHLIKLAGPNGVTEPVVLPATKILASGLLAKAGTVAIGKTEETAWVRFASGPWTYVVKAIEGTFPNYLQVIPGQFTDQIEFQEVDAEVLALALPALPAKTEHRGVVIHAAPEKVHILSEDLDNPSTIATAAKYAGKAPEQVLCANREYLVRGFKLGFRTLSFNDPLSPMMLSNAPADGCLVFMPLRGEVDRKKLAKALGKAAGRQKEAEAPAQATQQAAPAPVATSATLHGSAVTDGGRGLSEPEAKAALTRRSPKTAAPSDAPVSSDQCPATPLRSASFAGQARDHAESVASPQPANQKESQPMTEEKKPETAAAAPKPQLHVTGEEQDPFNELLTAIGEAQDQARLTLEKTNKLYRQVRETQRAVKTKEREFVKTQRLISDLKKVSGF